MAYTLDAREVLTAFVGKVDTISALQVAALYVSTLFDLRSCGGVQKLACGFVIDVLNEGGTIEFLRCKDFKKISVSVVQANGSVDVGDTDVFIGFLDDLFRLFVFGEWESEYGGVLCVYVRCFSAIIGLIPVANFSRDCVHGTFFRLSEDGEIGTCAAS